MPFKFPNLFPKRIPITNDSFKPEHYAAVPSKVDEVIRREPEKLKAAWDNVARDGFVSADDGKKLDRAILGEGLLLDGLRPMSSVEAKFLAQKLAADGDKMDPAVRASLQQKLAARENEMVAGKVFNGTFRAGDRLHTLTEGIIDMPYESFVSRMPPDLWGANLHDYRGGEIKVTARDDKGRVVEQRERMISETPYSGLLYRLFGGSGANNFGLPNDMTKVEKIVYDDAARSVAVKWEVLASDNRTTLVDVGELRFRAMEVTLPDGSKKQVTKVEMESEHRIDAFPGTLPLFEKTPVVREGIQAMTERVMRDYFTGCVKRYQEIGAGQAEVRPAP